MEEGKCRIIDLANGPLHRRIRQKRRQRSSLLVEEYGGVILIFCDFRKWAHCNRLAIFLLVQFLKIGEFWRVRSKVFILKKSQGA